MKTNYAYLRAKHKAELFERLKMLGIGFVLVMIALIIPTILSGFLSGNIAENVNKGQAGTGEVTKVIVNITQWIAGIAMAVVGLMLAITGLMYTMEADPQKKA